MTTVTRSTDLLRIADLSAAELHALLDLASAMKADPHGWRDALAGQSVACYFSKPSTRTRVSFEAAALTGIDLRLACPHGYRPDIPAQVFDDPAAAVTGARAVYTDVWVSMGEDAERVRRVADLSAYQVDPELMALAAPDAVFLHCLPAHRGEEVAPAVIDGPQSAVWQQAANRLPTEQAVLYALTSGIWEV